MGPMQKKSRMGEMESAEAMEVDLGEDIESFNILEQEERVNGRVILNSA